MSTMTRRAILHATAAGAALPATAAPTHTADPLLAMEIERHRWVELANASETDDDLDKFSAAAVEIDETMADTVATTLQGAIAKVPVAIEAYLSSPVEIGAGIGDQLMISGIEDLERLAGGGILRCRLRGELTGDH